MEIVVCLAPFAESSNGGGFAGGLAALLPAALAAPARLAAARGRTVARHLRPGNQPHST